LVILLPDLYGGLSKIDHVKISLLTKYPVLGYLPVLKDSPFQNIFEAD